MDRRVLWVAFLALTSGRAFGFSQEIHISISTEALSDMSYDFVASSEVVAGNLITDSDEYTNPAAHFDNESFADGSKRLRDKFEAALKALGDCDPTAARGQLGRGLHAVQDFFAHSNWVETKTSFEPIDLLHMQNSPNDAACDAASHLGPLTSGYYPDDRRPAPRKCVHAELNKDGVARPFHAAARARALQETLAFLARFDREIAARYAARGPDAVWARLRLMKDSSPTLRAACRR